MDVINGATDMQNEIDALLSRLTFPVLDWDWSPEIEWYPGDPLYTEPVVEFTYTDEDGNEVEGLGIPASADGEGGGQCIRPMIEWYDVDTDFAIEETFMDCDDCEVAGEPQAKSCWFCDKGLPGLWRPSSFTIFDPDISYREAPEGVSIERTWFHDTGDFIEDFDSGHWTAANQDFKSEMDVATWRSFTQHFAEPLPLSPWQERFLLEYAKADVDATRNMRVNFFMPRRNSGRAYMERLQSQVEEFFERGTLVPQYAEAPTNVQIQESRSRVPVQQNHYPTSSNPTQERRRRTH